MTRAGLLLLAMLLATPGVAAHAGAVAASPGWDEQLDEPPVEAWVQFSEPFDKQGSWLRVVSQDGVRVDLDNLQATDAPEPTMRIGLGPMENGSYVVLWQTFSPSDGHIVRGAIGFSVGPHEPASTEGLATEVSPLGMFARALTYAGVVVSVGLLGFVWFVKRESMVSTPRGDRWLLAAAAAAVSGAALLVLDVALATGLGGVALLASAPGRGLYVRLAISLGLALLTALWLFGPVQPRSRYHVLAVIWAALVLAGAQFGHNDGPTSQVVQFVHAMSMALWVGGLLAYLAWMRRDDVTAEDALALGPRFGTMALIASTLLVVTGVLLSVGILGSRVASEPFSDPWRTALTLKIGAALLMLLIAAVNRFIVLGGAPWAAAARARIRVLMRLEALGDSGTLRRLVAAEVLLGLVAVTLAAVLMSLAPAV